MAQRIDVHVFDDLDGGPADETVAFGYDGRSYEIDLTAKHAAQMRKAMQQFIDRGRRVTPRARRPVTGARAQTDREQTQAIRRWAQARGIGVSARGRISQDTLDAYQKAHEPTAKPGRSRSKAAT
jgi:hypothetical protein